eukprot:12927495-Prorocentrum_lima.AAC.1
MQIFVHSMLKVPPPHMVAMHMAGLGALGLRPKVPMGAYPPAGLGTFGSKPKAPMGVYPPA